MFAWIISILLFPSDRKSVIEVIQKTRKKDVPTAFSCGQCNPHFYLISSSILILGKAFQSSDDVTSVKLFLKMESAL